MNVADFSHTFGSVGAEIARVVVGQRELIDQTLIAVFARGHVLVEGVPGLGKTLLVRTMAHVMGATFKRIQFTPDLMPSDVTGGNVYSQARGGFDFVPGPVFTQLLLADEINRAPAKTQSALLEAMQDRSVTVDGKTRGLPTPFFVMATQNPIESQGTYPLPEAQLDRFLVKLTVKHPPLRTEKRLLKNYLEGFDPTRLEEMELQQVTHAEQMVELQAVLSQVRVDDEIVDYIADLVARTRSHPSVELGASPRGSVGLLITSRAKAASVGRDFVTPDDVKEMAPAVLRHRLMLSPDAELEGVTPDHCVASVLREAPVPKTAA